MEDEKIKDLFEGFQPALSSEVLFMARLKRNMESVEIVKRHTEAMRKRNRIAIGVAALVGFVMGSVLTMLLPRIKSSVASFALAVPSHVLVDIHLDWQFFGWVVTAAVSILTAINAYEITIARLSRGKLACD